MAGTMVPAASIGPWDDGSDAQMTEQQPYEVLEAHPEVAEISMSLPNLHHWTVDLSPFGIANDREVYVSTTEPHGLIEATIRRTDAG